MIKSMFIEKILIFIFQHINNNKTHKVSDDCGIYNIETTLDVLYTKYQI